MSTETDTIICTKMYTHTFSQNNNINIQNIQNHTQEITQRLKLTQYHAAYTDTRKHNIHKSYKEEYTRTYTIR